MSDHRRLQRTLFRMQADARFTSALLSGSAEALLSTGLGADDLALITSVDPIAIAADQGGKRRTQILGNATSEFRLTLAVLAERPDGAEVWDGFLRSPEFHRAMADRGRLPLAFAEYARSWAETKRAFVARAIISLEEAMATLRRRAQPMRDSPAPGEVRLAARASVVQLAAGTFDCAAELQAALDGETQCAKAREVERDATEVVLLRAATPPSRHTLPTVQPELLRAPADELFLRARSGLSLAQRADFARAQGAELNDLERFLDGFVDEGTLVRGT